MKYILKNDENDVVNFSYFIHFFMCYENRPYALIEPTKDGRGVCISTSSDGDYFEELQIIDKDLIKPIISRFKLMAGLNITENVEAHGEITLGDGKLKMSYFPSSQSITLEK